MERKPIKGRGTNWNPDNRFDNVHMSYAPEADPFHGAEASRPLTTLLTDASQTVIAKNNSPDVPFDKSINPYRGCEHGCIYCYARPTHEYLGMSAGLDFETKIVVKREAAALLRKRFASKRYTPEKLALSGVTDCYQPVERKLRVTRSILEVMVECRHPVTIITKNQLVTRDLDLLKELASFNCVSVAISVTSLRPELHRILEPRASTPVNRLEAVRVLREAGIPTGVMVAPIIPGLTDEEIIPILKAAGSAGARFAGKVVLRLPHAVAPLFRSWLETHMPDRADRVMNRVQALRGGRDYDSSFGARMSGTGPWSDQIAQWFKVGLACGGIPQEKAKLTTEHFRRPAGPQMELDLFT